jgi:hypothetical protein
MVIKNTTRWDTGDLRRLFSRCIQDVRRVEGRDAWRARNKGLIVTVQNDNSSPTSIHGRAVIGRYRILIKIGMEVDFTCGELGWQSLMKLARIFIHEYYHNLGYRDQDHRHYRNDYTADWDVGFLDGYSIGLAEPKPKVHRDIQMERYEKVLVKVKEYERKVKRSKTLLAKWKQKQRYYEKALMAAGKIKGKYHN